METVPKDVFRVIHDDSFFKGISLSPQINSENDLESFVNDKIRNAKLPLVLDIESKNYRGVHAAVVLGYDELGNVLVWEKIDIDMPYKISKLTELLDRHPHCYWGVRSFREKES